MMNQRFVNTEFPAGWRKTAEQFKPVEDIRVHSYEEAVSLLLNGYAIYPPITKSQVLEDAKS